MDINALYRLWLEKAAGHPALREELEAIRGDDAAIEDRFYRELEFGTGGLRGVLGAGTNRMNVFTVGKATQGYANYLKAHFAAPSVAIAYDSRINSRLFAETTAGVFAANGIRVHIYPRLMPTPSLSFAVRDLRSCGGVVITASHNPAKYNGYKVYGADGCQITTEAAAAIQSEIDRVDPFADVCALDFAEGLASGIIAYIGEDTVERYLAAVSAASLLPEDVSRSASIVYTPLNGTGISCVPRCLRAHGFANITIPPEQAEPDGTFPTCPYPNPEIREALSVGLRLAEKTGSELLLATDPDCDRVGGEDRRRLPAHHWQRNGRAAARLCLPDAPGKRHDAGAPRGGKNHRHNAHGGEGRRALRRGAAERSDRVQIHRRTDRASRKGRGIRPVHFRL